MINSKYILFNSIALIKDVNGRYLCDPFWAKDLKLHLAYISDLHLCAPVIEADENADMDALIKKVSYSFGKLTDVTDFPMQIVPLHYSDGWLGVIKCFLPNFLIINQAVTSGAIAHSDGAGWPFPLSFYLLPLKWFKSFNWTVVIESTFWEVKKGDKFSLIKSFTHYCHQTLLPLCLKAANARIFTHSDYQKRFFNHDENVHVAAYTNLDSEHLINDAVLVEKRAAIKVRTVRFLLACRLIEAKGIAMLMDAIVQLRKQGVSAQIDIMGSGPLEADCREFATLAQGSVEMAFIDPVPYGSEFFRFISSYDVMLITNLTEEQPRIVFDAFGQGLSIVASDTEGLKTICTHHANTILFKKGDTQSLVDAIVYATEHPQQLVDFASNGLAFAKTKTHQQMHKDRATFLQGVVGYK